MIGMDGWRSVDVFLNLPERNLLSRVSREFNRRQQQYLEKEKVKAARVHILQVLEASDEGTGWFDASFCDLGVGSTLETRGGFEDGTWTVRLNGREMEFDLRDRTRKEKDVIFELPFEEQREKILLLKSHVVSTVRKEAAAWVVSNF